MTDEIKEFLIVQKERITATNSPTKENRLPIFLPFQMNQIKKSNIYKQFLNDENKRMNSISFDTAIAKITLDSVLLCQIHKDLVDILLYFSTEKTFTSSATVFVKAPIYQIIKSLYRISGNNVYGNYNSFISLITDLKAAVITIETDELIHAYSVINSYTIVKDDKNYISIEFSSSFIKMMLSDSLIDYKAYIPDIIAIKSNIVKQLVRYCFTHASKTGTKINLNNFFQLFGFVSPLFTRDHLHNMKKEILSHKDLLKEKFNITIEDSSDKITVISKKLPEINYYGEIKIPEVLKPELGIKI